MQLVVGQLEAEADQTFNEVPFDLRIAQIWVEGSLGVVTQSNFPSKTAKPSTDNTALFNGWWQRYGYTGGSSGDASIIQESDSIKNYASTIMLQKYLGSESIIHGGSMFKQWNGDQRPLALVVSDWNEGTLDSFLLSLENRQHPFREIVVMRPLGTPQLQHSQVDRLGSFGITIVTIERQTHDYFDWCKAPVTADYFMYVNTYFKVRKPVDIVLTLDDKAVIPYILGDSQYCQQFSACLDSVESAKIFNAGADKNIQDQDMIFKTDERDKFIAEWMLVNPPPPENQCSPKGPSATSYFAYLGDRYTSLYAILDRADYGWRSAFKRVHKRQNMCTLTGDENSTTPIGPVRCRSMEDPVLCNSHMECVYDVHFSTCTVKIKSPWPTNSGRTPTTPPKPMTASAVASIKQVHQNGDAKKNPPRLRVSNTQSQVKN